MTYYERENIPFKAPQDALKTAEKEKASMKFFRKKGRAVKNWHERALLINPSTTRITIVKSKTEKQIPLWVYKKYAPQQLPTS
jgi:hypothetical protein